MTIRNECVTLNVVINMFGRAVIVRVKTETRDRVVFVHSYRDI